MFSYFFVSRAFYGLWNVRWLPILLLNAIVSSATEWIIDRLAESVAGKTVLFVGDGPRHDGTTDGNSDRYPGCVLIQRACESIKGFHFLDLEQIYIERFNADSMQFSLEGTLHWNSYANKVVAEAIHQALIEIGFPPPIQP